MKTNDDIPAWLRVLYLLISILSAFLVSFPRLDGIPGKIRLIQAVIFILLVWGRLAWAIARKEQKDIYYLYIGLMIIFPFLVDPLSYMLRPVYDFFCDSGSRAGDGVDSFGGHGVTAAATRVRPL